MATEADQISQAIEQTREDLGNTVQALVHKADVKAQVAKKVERTKAKSKAQAQEALHKVSDAPAKAVSNKRVGIPLAAIVLGLASAFVALRLKGKAQRDHDEGLPSVVTSNGKRKDGQHSVVAGQ